MSTRISKYFLIIGFFLLLIVGAVISLSWKNRSQQVLSDFSVNEGGPGTIELEPLTIAAMRNRAYPGSEITVLENIDNGSNYTRQIVSYQSDGFAVHALLTVPLGETPNGGWPAIIFNHGYIPPEQYETTARYVSYVDGFARNGYVVIKPDFRGHGESEGTPEGAYYSPAYTIDSLNALSSIKKLPYVNLNKIGMWGHSMGGHISLKSMVLSGDIKAGVIWGGVVASHTDMYLNWRRRPTWTPSQREIDVRRMTRQKFVEKYGEPDANPEFWQSISPIFYVSDISGPVQLHHGQDDASVPIEFSLKLKDALEKAGKTVEFYEYTGADHNLSQVFGTAMQRSVNFFDKYLKGY